MSDVSDPVGLLRRSPLFDADWYLARYPDVARSGMDPAAHYHFFGAALARDPGPGFSSRAYLRMNPDVAQAGVPALLHYLGAGRAEGRAPHDPVVPPSGPGRIPAVAHLRALMRTGGLDAAPREALRALARDDTPEAPAACEALVLAGLDSGDPAETETYLARWEQLGAPPERLVPLRLRAAALAGDSARAQALYRPETDRSLPAETHLAASAALASAEERLAALAAAMAGHGLAAPQLLAARSGLLKRRLPDFDRLCAGPDRPDGPGAAPTTGPEVSVLLPVRDAAATLPTTLRAMAQQRFTDWELLAVDDASRDGSWSVLRKAAAQDPRIRPIRLEAAGGPNAACNAALAEARGALVTRITAGGWIHPERLARQVAWLGQHPWVPGCTALRARLTPELRATGADGSGRLGHDDPGALMLPRRLLLDHLGGWDRLRDHAGAEAELLRRVRRLFGETAVSALPELLSLERQDSATDSPAGRLAAPVLDDPGTGAGQAYLAAQSQYHRSAPHLRYDSGPRRFPAPAALLPEEPGKEALLRLDRAYAGLFQYADKGLETLLGWLDEDRAAGRSAGLVPLYSSRQPAWAGLGIAPVLRARIDGISVQILSPGTRAEAALYRRLPGQFAEEPQRNLPWLRAGGRDVLIPGQPPAAG